MTRAFRLALLTTLAHEGGYSNHPADRGGETFAGISRRHHPGWAGWPVLDSYPLERRERLKPLDDPELGQLVADFYHDEFWQPLHLDELGSEILACELFDSAVNVGPGRAARWLQHTCNLLGCSIKEDGDIGPQTLGAARLCVSTYGSGTLNKILNGLQFEHYHQLVEKDPSQRAFFRGWLSRVWERREPTPQEVMQ